MELTKNLELTERISDYWNKRIDDFANLRLAELNSEKRDLWLEVILPKLPKGRNLKILDVGTGTGFFAVLLTEKGHNVVGIDLSSSMIENSKKTADILGYNIDFKVMNAQELEFRDEEFDVVISRNLTWTLPDAKKAYSEWFRVLKKGGTLINFDANYGSTNFYEESKTLGENHAHAKIDSDLTKECDRIKDQLRISYEERPNWDMKVLDEIGFVGCKNDYKISDKIYKNQDDQYNPTKMFGIYALRP